MLRLVRKEGAVRLSGPPWDGLDLLQRRRLLVAYQKGIATAAASPTLVLAGGSLPMTPAA